MLNVLLEFNDDLEIRDDFNWTLLMTAVHRGSKSNVKLLLERNANIDCDSANGMYLIAVAMSFHDIGKIEIETKIKRIFFIEHCFTKERKSTKEVIDRFLFFFMQQRMWTDKAVLITRRKISKNS